jgi:hypothetical protein
MILFKNKVVFVIHSIRGSVQPHYSLHYRSDVNRNANWRIEAVNWRGGEEIIFYNIFAQLHIIGHKYFYVQTTSLLSFGVHY